MMKKVRLFFIAVVVMFVMSGCSRVNECIAYINNIQDEIHSIHNELVSSSNKILEITVNYDKGDSFSAVSDLTQIKNALTDGGRIISNSDFENFPSGWKSYGADDAEGYFYTKGAMLNYVASKGWELVHVTDRVNSFETYYFNKR